MHIQARISFLGCDLVLSVNIHITYFRLLIVTFLHVLIALLFLTKHRRFQVLIAKKYIDVYYFRNYRERNGGKEKQSQSFQTFFFELLFVPRSLFKKKSYVVSTRRSNQSITPYLLKIVKMEKVQSTVDWIPLR
jgi:hypothetical protein